MDLFVKNDNKPLAVGEFLLIARQTVEEKLPTLWVKGEVANFVRATSGHWYFVLRDADGQVDCMMPGRFNVLSLSPPAAGDMVEVMAQPSIYAPRGRFQLMVRFVRPVGAGERYQIFVARKKAWTARGWFDSAHKRKPPFWPATIGVVSSADGAALRDVLRTLDARMPAINVIIYPAPAQGADAAEKIATAIRTAGRRAECELLIVCRGGGGIEDLWAYNEEPVVAAIVDSPIPVITGIGHETDETLADFAADSYAPTPTGAAVLASPDSAALRKRLHVTGGAFYRQTRQALSKREQRLDWAVTAIGRPVVFLNQKHTAWRRLTTLFSAVAVKYEMNSRQQFKIAAATFRHPAFAMQATTVNTLLCRLLLAAKRCCLTAEQHLHHHQQTLTALHPQRTLERGYGMVWNASGQTVSDSEQLRPLDSLTITFARGNAQTVVQTINNNKMAEKSPRGNSTVRSVK